MSSFPSVPCFAFFLHKWIFFVLSFVWHSLNLSWSFCRNSKAVVLRCSVEKVFLQSTFSGCFWHLSFKFSLHLSFLFQIFVCRSSAVAVFTFLKMFDTHMFENFLWKSSAIVKLQVYTNSSLKISCFTGIFEAFILGLKCHKTYFAENLWVAPVDISCIYFSFIFEYCK